MCMHRHVNPNARGYTKYLVGILCIWAWQPGESRIDSYILFQLMNLSRPQLLSFANAEAKNFRTCEDR